MGVRLVAEVLDHAPCDLTPAERLVLVVLAEDARDETRTCWPGMDKLVRRTGLKPDSLRRVFQRLSKRGLEVRVPIKITENGPVFAREGVQTNYRIPPFQGPSRDARPASSSVDDNSSRDQGPATEEGPESPHSQGEAGCSSHRGGTVVPLRRDARPAQEAGPSSRPSPQYPSVSRQYSPHTAREARSDVGDTGGLFPSDKEKAEAAPEKKPAPGSDADPEFTEWWALYPKKADKGRARKEWKKARKIATFDQLMDGLKRYMTLDRDYQRGYVKNPATWLTAEGWANEYDQAPPQHASGGHQSYQNPHDQSVYDQGLL